MKTLILARHAKSSWKQPELSDIDRPLNKRGKRDAPFMSRLMAEKSIVPDLIISSPANRAATTAKNFAEKFSFSDDEIILFDSLYLADTNEILDVIHTIDNSFDTIMLFGHNPGLTLATNYITDEYIDNIPTCGLVTIELAIDSWNEVDCGSGKIICFEYPKKYFQK